MQSSTISLPLLQSPWWGRFKALFGWKPLYSLIDGMPLLILRREVMLGREIWYIPWGPAWVSNSRPTEKIMPEMSVEDVSAATSSTALVAESLYDAIMQKDFDFQPPIALRFDLPFGSKDCTFDEISRESCISSVPGLRHPSVEIQVPATVILDLRKSWEELLAGMKKKTRYNIRLAEKKAVRICNGNSSDLGAWYAMYQETAERDGIVIHSQDYYEAFFRLAEDAQGPTVDFLLAYHENDLLAGIFVARYDGVATYMYGASNNLKRNLMPAYLLQARAIQNAMEAGCHSYDFLGIPSTSHPDHPMHGLYRFKTGFGGTHIRRIGLVDKACRKPLYRCFRLAESLRSWYFSSLRKRF
ncbi:lipid II:glycine glycyltransferase FemX [Spirochaeta dissipatitropha]